MKTPQSVIKKLMAALANHNLPYSDSIGTQMLDVAVKASSKYNGVQEVIDAMKAAQESAEKEAVEEVLGWTYRGELISDINSTVLEKSAFEYDDVYKKSNIYLGEGYTYTNYSTMTVKDVLNERKAYIFLEKYCGIQLEKKYWFNGKTDDKGNRRYTYWSSQSTGNVDTGAITGSDANLTLREGDVVSGKTLTDGLLSAIAQREGSELTSDEQSDFKLIIGSGVEKTARSVVPEDFINTYVASTSAAQVINTGTRNWVVQATGYNDTINSNGADSINSGAGNDQINIKETGATVTSGSGDDTISISAAVKDVTITDLSGFDEIKISGTFEVGSAQIEDTLLVITDKTGTRKIRLGDLETAKNGKINSTTVANWLSNAGIDINNLKTTTYAEKQGVKSYSSSTTSENFSSSEEGDGRKIIDSDWTPEPLAEEKEKKPVEEIFDGTNANSANTANSTITVNLNKVDTSKAGDVSIGGAKVGELSSTYPNASTFTRNGLTIHLLGELTAGAVQENISEEKESYHPGRITLRTFEELSTDQKTLIAALFKWWGQGGTQINEDSYDMGFESSTAKVKDIGLYFYDDGGHDNVLAAVWSWWNGNGDTTKLMLSINLHYYGGISTTDMDGTATVGGGGFLDRTLAHEFTHANMSTNIKWHGNLPKFAKEGLSELTHGTDDERGYSIFKIAYDAEELDASLALSNTGTGDQDKGNGYAGGYMFWRYFAKTAAEQTLFDVDYTFTDGDDNYTNTLSAVEMDLLDGNNTLTSEGDYVTIKAGDDDNLITSAGSDIKISTGRSGKNTIDITDSNEVSISSGEATIYGFRLNDTLKTVFDSFDIETVGNNLEISDGIVKYTLIDRASLPAELMNITGGIEHGSESELATPYIFENHDSNVLITGEDRDSIISDGDNVTIDAGDKRDIIKAKGYNNSISGGAGNDDIKLEWADGSTVRGDGDNDNILIADSSGITAYGGAGDDTITIENGVGGSNKIYGGDGVDLIIDKNCQNTIDGGKGGDTVKSYAGHSSIRAYDGDKIYLLGGVYSTVDVSDGDNFIYNDENSALNHFIVSGSGNSTISGLKSNSTLEFKDPFTRKKLSDGNQYFQTEKGSVTVIYSKEYFSLVGPENKPEWSIIGTTATYGDLFTLSGLNSNVKLSDLAYDDETNTITLSKGALNKSTVTLLAPADSPYNLALASDVETWEVRSAKLSGGTYTSEGITAGYKVNGDTIDYKASTIKTVKFDGLSSAATADDIYVAGSKIKISANAMAKTNGATVKILTDGYTLVRDSKTMPLAKEVATDLTDGVYTKGGKTEGYTLASDAKSISYNTATTKTVEFSGLSSAATADDITVAGSKVKISANAMAKTNGATVKILTDGYTLVRDSKTMPLAKEVATDLTDGVYTKGGKTAGYTLASDAKSISYNTATTKTVEFSGLSSAATADDIYVAGSKIKISANAMPTTNGSTVKILTDGYTLVRDSKTMPLAKEVATDLTDGVYTKGGTTAGYTVSTDGKSISYNTATTKTVEFSGLSSAATADDIYVAGKAVKFTANAVPKTDGATVELKTEGYRLVLDSKTMKAPQSTTATLANGIYNAAGKTAGYTLADNAITYSAATLELGGVAKKPAKPASGVMTLTADNFSKKMSVLGNAGGYKFSIAKGTYTGKTFAGSGGADTITSAANNLIINGGSGNDSIKTSGTNSKVLGGAGKDTLTGGTGTDTCDGGAGNDLLNGGKGNDSLYGGAGADILRGGLGNDTLWGGAGNDSLYGDSGADIFIYKPNEGTDTIFDYESGDVLKILKTNGEEGGTFKNATFSDDTLTLSISGGGKVIFDGVSAGDEININGTRHVVGH